jgi:DNA polymerase-3 subunit chi
MSEPARPEIRFYHLQRQTQEQVLPVLLGKALETGRRVVVRMRDAGEVAEMNEHLWSFRADSFLPHGSAKDGFAERQPVWLTDIDENPNGADMMIVGQGADAAPSDHITLRCEFLDGADEGMVSAARERWRSYKDAGYEVTYWSQTERGGWERK